MESIGFWTQLEFPQKTRSCYQFLVETADSYFSNGKKAKIQELKPLQASLIETDPAKAPGWIKTAFKVLSLAFLIPLFLLFIKATYRWTHKIEQIANPSPPPVPILPTAATPEPATTLSSSSALLSLQPSEGGALPDPATPPSLNASESKPEETPPSKEPEKKLSPRDGLTVIADKISQDLAKVPQKKRTLEDQLLALMLPLMKNISDSNLGLGPYEDFLKQPPLLQIGGAPMPTEVVRFSLENSLLSKEETLLFHLSFNYNQLPLNLSQAPSAFKNLRFERLEEKGVQLRETAIRKYIWEEESEKFEHIEEVYLIFGLAKKKNIS